MHSLGIYYDFMSKINSNLILNTSNTGNNNLLFLYTSH